ncbi:MAG: TRAP transporter fused permease subunit [Bacillota bacterium]
MSSDLTEKAQEMIERFEGVTRPLTGRLGTGVAILAVATSLYHLYAAVSTVTTQIHRGIHLLLVLVLTFLLYPARKNRFASIHWWDWALAGLAILPMGYMFLDFGEFVYRSASPLGLDLVMGTITIVLVLEATRRTVGPALPTIALGFLAYAWLGPYLPEPWAHRGYGLDRLVGHTYMTLEGIFGVPIDVSSTFIVLFTIYGAVLEQSLAGKFFVDFSLAAMGRRRTSAGRTVTLASFLLGTVSGSGVATTVTLGSVAYPLLKRAGYDRDTAGALLAAGGIGAVLSPPVLGAASFIIAEILKVSYLEVIMMATIPTLLYYLGILLMIEVDARRFTLAEVAAEGPRAGELARRYWYHFTSLITIVVLMAAGFTAIWAVFWATLIAVVVSYVRLDTALHPARLFRALESGARGILTVAPTCACAGIIVGVVTLTGLGLKFSSVILDLAGGNLLLTLLLTAAVLLVLGLALPITASYIVAAVITAPALIKLGVPEFAAHMFIFYYAVLSEVSPPVALSPVAAAALTGGNPFRTMMITWKYTLPAFLVPFMFSLHPSGTALLLKAPPLQVLWALVTGVAGVAALAGALGGWLLGPAHPLERALLGAASLLLLYPAVGRDLAGAGAVALAVGIHVWRYKAGKRRVARERGPERGGS